MLIFLKDTFKNCKIINEENILPLKKFTYIANKYFVKSNYYQKIQSRLSWYYQQILKISFMIDFVAKEQEPMLMWDADAILLKSLIFLIKEKLLSMVLHLSFIVLILKLIKKYLRITKILYCYD